MILGRKSRMFWNEILRINNLHEEEKGIRRRKECRRREQRKGRWVKDGRLECLGMKLHI